MRPRFLPFIRPLVSGLCLGALGLLGVDASVSPLLIDREWRFHLGDAPGAAAVDYDATAWERTHLPHSFSLPYFLAPDFYVGAGWYRKALELHPRVGRSYALDFDGVFDVCDVYVNGHRAGGHVGGYTGFEVEITPFVTEGTNVVAVRVSNEWNPRVAPRAGEHTFSGGIYRDVHLVERADVHVTWYGLAISTPGLETGDTSVAIAAEITNASDRVRSVSLAAAIGGQAGQGVSTRPRAVTLPARAVATVTLITPPVPAVRLWSPETPVLYTATVSVVESGAILDAATDTFGFRTIRWTADRGFFLNGTNRYLRGANVHQDRAGWGDAATCAAFARDLKMVKEAGFDTVRGSHYPHHPEFARACDRLGLLFWSENCFWGTGGSRPTEKSWFGASAYPSEEADRAPFEASVLANLRDMIRINRNRPSIICWSLSNEPFFTDPKTLPAVRDFLQRLAAAAHAADSTRPAAVGGAQRGHLDHCADIAGYNGDGERLPEYQNPGVPSIVSEYGSRVEDRPGRFDGAYDGGLCGTRRHAWRSGEILWCGFDHGSIAGHFGSMGMIDYFRLPKRRWFWYRERLAGVKAPPPRTDGQPARLVLAADKTTIEHADGTDDIQLTVSVCDADGKGLFSSPDVTLRVLSGPGEFPTGRAITFSAKSDIAIRDGLCAIDFRSYYSGRTVIEATSPGLAPARIEIESRGAPAFDPAKSVVIESRPYVRYRRDTPAAKSASFNLAFSKPTLASPAVAGHSPSLAVDGDPATVFIAAGTGASFLQVTPERIVKPSSIRIVFPRSALWRCGLECSVDGAAWTKVADTSAAAVPFAEHRFNLGGRYEGIYFRLVFSAGGAAVAEFEIRN